MLTRKGIKVLAILVVGGLGLTGFFLWGNKPTPVTADRQVEAEKAEQAEQEKEVSEENEVVEATEKPSETVAEAVVPQYEILEFPNLVVCVNKNTGEKIWECSNAKPEESPAEEIVPTDETAPAKEIVPADETAPAEEIISTEETAPAEEIVSTEETAPAEETSPAEETAPAEETSPAEETAPAEEIVSAEETAPAEEPTVEEASAEETSNEEVLVEEEVDAEEDMVYVFAQVGDETPLKDPIPASKLVPTGRTEGEYIGYKTPFNGTEIWIEVWVRIN